MNPQEDKARFEAAVQEEVNRRLAEQQKQFSEMMDLAMKNALKGIDDAQAKLEKKYKALEKEEKKWQKLQANAEKEGEKLATTYFEKSRAALIEFTQKEQLRKLAYHHLQAGRSVEDICLWLQAPREFVEHLIEIMDRKADYRSRNRPQPSALEYRPRLRYEGSGRGGTIWFENDLSSFDMWWEFGGGSALVIIDVPSEQQWVQRTKLPLEQRTPILHFIAQQVIRDQTTSPHSYEIGDSLITIFR